MEPSDALTEILRVLQEVKDEQRLVRVELANQADQLQDLATKASYKSSSSTSPESKKAPTPEPKESFLTSSLTEATKGRRLASRDSSEEDFKDDRPLSRRLSMFEKGTKTAEEDSIKLVMQARQPSFAHIRLKATKIPDIFEFFEGLNDYEVTNKITLTASALLDKEIVHHLANVSGETTTRILGLSNIQLMSLLQKEVRPTNRLDFAFLLSNSKWLFL